MVEAKLRLWCTLIACYFMGVLGSYRSHMTVELRGSVSQGFKVEAAVGSPAQIVRDEMIFLRTSFELW
jgi:hypothetical protein